MVYFTQYDRPPNVFAPKCKLDLTEQQYKADCDIGSVLRRFAAGDRTVVRDNAIFADVSQIGDFASCMEMIRRANDAFADLPSEVRERFSHNPIELVRFIQDEKNYNEALRLGLIKSKDSVKDKVDSQASVTTENKEVAEDATSSSAS